MQERTDGQGKRGHRGDEGEHKSKGIEGGNKEWKKVIPKGGENNEKWF